MSSALGAVVTATMGGYAFVRLRFRGNKLLFTLCVGSMLLPSMVTLIPLFLVWAKLEMVNTYWPLILPHFCGEERSTFSSSASLSRPCPGS